MTQSNPYQAGAGSLLTRRLAAQRANRVAASPDAAGPGAVDAAVVPAAPIEARAGLSPEAERLLGSRLQAERDELADLARKLEEARAGAQDAHRDEEAAGRAWAKDSGPATWKATAAAKDRTAQAELRLKLAFQDHLVASDRMAVAHREALREARQERKATSFGDGFATEKLQALALQAIEVMGALAKVVAEEVANAEAAGADERAIGRYLDEPNCAPAHGDGWKGWRGYRGFTNESAALLRLALDRCDPPVSDEGSLHRMFSLFGTALAQGRETPRVVPDIASDSSEEPS